MSKAHLYLYDSNSNEVFHFHGDVYGARRSVVGEIVFQTGMVGYVESLTDPSYARQLLVLTYPLIGNYGVPDSTEIDECGLPVHFESNKVWPSALIVDKLCPENEHSHWEAVCSLDQYLRLSNVPCLTGIDTRQLTKIIRSVGSMKAKLIMEGDGDEKSYGYEDINTGNLVAEVSRERIEVFGEGSLKILVIDCGIKNNQIRCLVRCGAQVKVVPWDHPFDTDKDYDGLFLSSGPGDPCQCSSVCNRLKKVMQKDTIRPIFGICLGHQLLARSVGAETMKLKYGNRGHNQPCVHLDSGRCFITSQNHGYAVDVEQGLPFEWQPLFVNENDGTNEGIVHDRLPYFSVQFHPEHKAGPSDMQILFDVFVDCVRQWKMGNKPLIKDLISEKFHYNGIYKIPEQRKVLVLGSGGLTIGQAGEFDYSGAQALKALKQRSIRTVLINPNVAAVQTSKGFADKTYFLPITKEYVADVIKKERPTGILCTFGGQTALNCATELYKAGIFEQYNVCVLGTPIETIIKTEDRNLFSEEMKKINEPIAPSKSATSLEEAEEAAAVLGYPLLIRSAYALGGLGSGFAENRDELVAIVQTALSSTEQVLIDKSLKGWKELEYEVVRDAYDNCITVCNMENIDPLGIHTGDSIVVAPSQTLSNTEYQVLRATAIKVIRHFGIIGECNIQYAVNPKKFEYRIIEINARLSRSSALASKATGYPLASIAALLALGESLPKIRNSITGNTTACFEPSLDYCVVKIPRWDLNKFARVDNVIGSCMKSIGEVMGIGRSFEEAFQKAVRMVNESVDGFSPYAFGKAVKDSDISIPTDKRIYAIALGLYDGYYGVNRINELTNIDLWFLHRFQNIINKYSELKEFTINNLPTSLLREAKQLGFSDNQIAGALDSEENVVRKRRKESNIEPFVKQIDTVAAEWPAVTNYLFTTYNGFENDISFDLKRGVIVLGSGVYRIGSSVEFDACCVDCINELKKLGYKPITINCNPETTSTDYDVCERLYFDEISYESVLDIYEKERPLGLILSVGGQIPNNIAISLARTSTDTGITIFGTSPNDIDSAENRFKFSRLLDSLEPQWKETGDESLLEKFCENTGYPCLIRPSYVLSGAAMNVAHDQGDLRNFLRHATVISKDHPVVVSKFISEAKEIDVDAVALHGKVVAMAISEHVENAGIHSGDATLVTPPQDLNQITLDGIDKIVRKIAKALNVIGPFNLQLIAKENELKVIECNLRSSRSFPFVSKTLGYNFIALATRCMMAANNHRIYQSLQSVEIELSKERVGVKVPVFSFSRLAGADAMLGVEMISTGEVACFGRNRHEAYLKGLLATGFVIPKKTIFLSVGGYHAKSEMLRSVQLLHAMGFTLYASKGSADYFSSNKIPIRAVDWPVRENASRNEKTAFDCLNLESLFAERKVHLVINLPIRGSGAYRVSAYQTMGYKTRRMAIDNSVPLITDIKSAKLFVEALWSSGARPLMNTFIDSIFSSSLLRLPGFIDIHAHLREPGGEHKETWESGTKASVVGGITMVLAMPNTSPPVVDCNTLMQVNQIAMESAIVDYGLYLGGTPSNSEEVERISADAAALKLYLNSTFSTLEMPNMSDWAQHFSRFPKDRVIVCHAENQTLAAVLFLSHLMNRAVHIAHVSTAEEIWLVREAKDKQWKVTCEVAPHHLFLTNDSDLGEGWKEVRPSLGTSEDVEALWSNLEYIDCFASDHAPHTREEKINNKLPGFPSIEYMVPLLLNAVNNGKLTMKQLVDRLYHNPMKIFNLPVQENTHIEVDMSDQWTIPNDGGLSKAGWTPYAGMVITGRIRTVVIRGEEVFVDGQIVVDPGFGMNIRSAYFTDERKIQSRSCEDADALDSVPYRNTMRKSGSQNIDYAWEDTFDPVPSGKKSPDSNSFKLRYNKSLLSADDLTKADVKEIINLAAQYQLDTERRVCRNTVLTGYVMASMFYEPSTRTSCSFAAAMQRLGGLVLNMDVEKSSVQKGETLEDSIMIMSGYSDVIVLRHPEVGAAKRASKLVQKPIINAGDGAGQHPTQALTDLFTIRDELGTINCATIAMVGDLLYGRTVHSLAKLLCLYRGITLHYVVPSTMLSMPKEIKDYVASFKIQQREFTNLAEGIQGVDVIYMTRLQKERFDSIEEYDKLKDSFILTQKLLNQVSHSRRLAGKGLARKLPIVMHPLPRANEISAEIDSDKRAAYFHQARNGMYVRMAILTLIFDRKSSVVSISFP